MYTKYWDKAVIKSLKSTNLIYSNIIYVILKGASIVCVYEIKFAICQKWGRSVYIVGIPPFLIKGRGLGPSKNWVTWEGLNFLLKREDKPERGGGGKGWCKNGGLPLLLLYSSVTFTVSVGKIRFPLLFFRPSNFWVSHARFSSKSLLY